jgi:hypothetical protein
MLIYADEVYGIISLSILWLHLLPIVDIITPIVQSYDGVK